MPNNVPPSVDLEEPVIRRAEGGAAEPQIDTRTSDYAEGYRDGHAKGLIADREYTYRIGRLGGISRPEMHPATADLVMRFGDALRDKLAAAEVKYGYSDGWLSPDWMDECRAKLLEHVAKGDPRDVAAYCAFLWHHGESTALAAKDGAAGQEQAGALDRAITFKGKDYMGTLYECIERAYQAGLEDAAPGAAIAAREQETAPDLLDVLITANDGSGNTWTRIEVIELAEGLEAIASAAVMDGSKMNKEAARRDREWCRYQATYAALALRSLASRDASPTAPKAHGGRNVE